MGKRNVGSSSLATSTRRRARGERALRATSPALAALLLLPMAATRAGAAELPRYLDIVVDRSGPATKQEIAAANVTALDEGMQRIYAGTLEKYREHLRERFPVILGLFTETGGSMILYRPGQDPVVADPVPPIYAWLKSVSHTSMAVYQLVAPYLADPSDGSWRQPMLAYVGEVEGALATLGDLEVSPEIRDRLRRMLEKDRAFMKTCLDTGRFSLETVTAFARDLEADIVQNVALAARTQVEHWESVLGAWKKSLGDQWDDTYAVTNTLYVTRQNNILFTILAQLMGREAINDRLMLIGTTSFTTTPDELLDQLTRIVADRAVGKVFFGDVRVMDAELLGGAARKAIEEEAAAKGEKALLPRLAPFDTHAWPWPTDPASGSGPAEMEQIPPDR
jgi:hypothetical protein